MAVREFLDKPVPPPRVEQGVALSHLVRRTHNRLRSKEMRDREAVDARMAQREPWAATLAKHISRTHFRTRGRYDTGTKYPHLAAAASAAAAAGGRNKTAIEGETAVGVDGAGSGDQGQEQAREPLLVMLQTRKLLSMADTVLAHSGAMRVGQQQVFLATSQQPPLQQQGQQQLQAWPHAPCAQQRLRQADRRPDPTGAAPGSSGQEQAELQQQLVESARVWAGAAAAAIAAGRVGAATAPAPPRAVDLGPGAVAVGPGHASSGAADTAAGLRAPDLEATLFALARYGPTTRLPAPHEEETPSPAALQQGTRAASSGSSGGDSEASSGAGDGSSAGSSSIRGAAGGMRRRQLRPPFDSSGDAATSNKSSGSEGGEEDEDGWVEMVSAPRLDGWGMQVDGGATHAGSRPAVTAAARAHRPPQPPGAAVAASAFAVSAAADSAAAVASTASLLSPWSHALSMTGAVAPACPSTNALATAVDVGNVAEAVDAAARLPGYVQRLPMSVQQHVLADSLTQLLACSRGLVDRAERLLGGGGGGGGGGGSGDGSAGASGSADGCDGGGGAPAKAGGRAPDSDGSEGIEQEPQAESESASALVLRGPCGAVEEVLAERADADQTVAGEASLPESSAEVPVALAAGMKTNLTF